MERLTTEQIEDIVDDLNNFDFLPVGQDGRKPYEQICKGAEQMRDELLAYKHLEEEIGCPIEVRCKLYNGALICDTSGKILSIHSIDKNSFECKIPVFEKSIKAVVVMNRIFSFSDYKMTWWLKDTKEK